MKILYFVLLAILISCGGGSSSVASEPTSSSNSNPNEGLSLLPGSVNSFQPLDIDD